MLNFNLKKILIFSGFIILMLFVWNRGWQEGCAGGVFANTPVGDKTYQKCYTVWQMPFN